MYPRKNRSTTGVCLFIGSMDKEHCVILQLCRMVLKVFQNDTYTLSVGDAFGKTGAVLRWKLIILILHGLSNALR